MADPGSRRGTITKAEKGPLVFPELSISQQLTEQKPIAKEAKNPGYAYDPPPPYEREEQAKVAPAAQELPPFPEPPKSVGEGGKDELPKKEAFAVVNVNAPNANANASSLVRKNKEEEDEPEDDSYVVHEDWIRARCKCGKELKKNYNRCPRCGRCVCGERLENSWKRCPNCDRKIRQGRRIAEEITPKTTVVQPIKRAPQEPLRERDPRENYTTFYDCVIF